MTEHLVRGKRIDNNQWVEGYYTGVYNDPCIDYLKDGIPHTVVVKKETVSFFTGWCDNKGCKMFQHDIVEYPDFKGPCPITNLGVVTWSCWDGFFFSNYQILNIVDLSNGNSTIDCLIVGNIFDNPDVINSFN